MQHIGLEKKHSSWSFWLLKLPKLKSFLGHEIHIETIICIDFNAVNSGNSFKSQKDPKNKLFL